MQIALVSLFPEMFTAVGDHGVTGRAVKQGLVTLRHSNPRDYTVDKHRTVDDRPYGGGPGMLMKIDPLQQAIAAAREAIGADATDVKVIYLSPQGQRFTHGIIARLVDKFLAVGHGCRTLVTHLFRQFQRPLLRRPGGNHLFHKSDAQRRVRLDPLTTENHLLGPAFSHQPGQALGSAGAGQQAYLGFRQRHLGLLFGYTHVTGQCCFQPATHGKSIDRRYYQYGGIVDRVDQRM